MSTEITKNEKSSIKLAFKNLAAFCPHCYESKPISKIAIKASIELDDESNNYIDLYNLKRVLFIHDMSELILEYKLSETSVLNNIKESYHIFNFQCEYCDKRMIVLDKPMTYYVKEFCKYGMYTKYSCEGHEDYDGYITPYLQFYNIQFVLDILKSKYAVSFKCKHDDIIVYTIHYCELLSDQIDPKNGKKKCKYLQELEWDIHNNAIYLSKNAPKDHFLKALDVLLEIIAKAFDYGYKNEFMEKFKEKLQYKFIEYPISLYNFCLMKDYRSSINDNIIQEYLDYKAK